MQDNVKARLLDKLNLPKDLQDLSQSQLEQLAQEIRELLLDIGDKCGGHLASNLGVVELTLVLHTLFSTPNDKFVWDTSHQAYVHKILTGRKDQMFTVRKKDGLSGFANIFESDHDAFGAGHASTSLSAALGMAQAREVTQDDYKVVAIFGDSALSGGMAFEALNNLEGLKSNLICILNDNDMSISEPVGSMAHYMTKVRTAPVYNQARKTVLSAMEAIPKVGGPLKRRVEKALDHFREFILDSKFGTLFEEFGVKYLGPLDGHNIPLLMAAINYAKTYEGPILIHIVTQKGKGYDKAEANPIKYHGISPKTQSATKTTGSDTRLSYQEVFANSMMKICEAKSDVVAITPAMKGGSGLTAFAERFPKQFYDVGIAEEHAVTFAAGLARCGVRPVLAIYSTFLQRGYDQLLHDVCLQNLPVVFALDRAGLVGQDGATHQGLFDIGYMLPIPNLTILAPKDAWELEDMLQWAVTQDGPVSVRYPKEKVPVIDAEKQLSMSEQLLTCVYEAAQPSAKIDLLILAVGSTVVPSVEAAKALQSNTVNVTVINLRCLKPLDTAFLATYFDRAERVLVVEEGQEIGGVFGYIYHCVKDQPVAKKAWQHLAVPDVFVEHASIPEQREMFALDQAGILKKAQACLAQQNNNQAKATFAS
eukprot:COSAG01_NODE_1_length_100484_cov_170.446142_55_plen_650_part_00